MRAWGFWSLDPARDGVRLELIAELAGVAPVDASAEHLLRAIVKHEPSGVVAAAARPCQRPAAPRAGSGAVPLRRGVRRFLGASRHGVTK